MSQAPHSPFKWRKGNLRCHGRQVPCISVLLVRDLQVLDKGEGACPLQGVRVELYVAASSASRFKYAVPGVTRALVVLVAQRLPVASADVTFGSAEERVCCVCVRVLL